MSKDNRELHIKELQNWQKEKINNLAKQLAKALAGNQKEGRWYLYSLRFKKEKNGEVTISDPDAEEVNRITKL